MEKNNDIFLVVIITFVFGVASKILVGVPYMAWGYFDQLFVASFILWMLYTTMLYVAIKVQEIGNKNYFKMGVSALAFGIVSACLKMGIDALTEQLAKLASHLLVVAFMMEIGILIFGSGIILLLYVYIAQKRILWNKSIKVYAIAEGVTIGMYFAVMLYYLWQLKYWMERFSNIDMIKDVGEEQGILNLSTKYARESTMMGTITYVVFFILLWIALKKNTEKKDMIIAKE